MVANMVRYLELNVKPFGFAWAWLGKVHVVGKGREIPNNNSKKKKEKKYIQYFSKQRQCVTFLPNLYCPYTVTNPEPNCPFEHCEPHIVCT